MREGQRVIQTPGLHKATEQDHPIDEDGEPGPEKSDAGDRPGYPARQRGMPAAIALARHGREIAPPQPQPLRQKGRQRETQKHRRQHSRAGGIMLRADDRKEDLGRQDAAIAAQHQRVPEIRHRFDEPD